MIRITGGKDRSRLLKTPDSELTKPTMDKVRAAVFSALSFKVENAEILDLFAGSGSYGFESLSRGAASATFVDKSMFAFNTIKENQKTLKYENTDIIYKDVLTFLNETEKTFDIIFADPPYKLEIYSDLMKVIKERNLLNDGGVLVLESEKELDINIEDYKEVRFYKYGLAKIYIIRK